MRKVLEEVVAIYYGAQTRSGDRYAIRGGPHPKKAQQRYHIRRFPIYLQGQGNGFHQ